MSATLHYTMYQSTTIGEALKETLEEFTSDGTITQHLAKRILLNFDKAVNTKLATQNKNRFNFKASKLRAYRFCDNVWTFVVESVEVRDVNTKQPHTVEHMKIVACDASKKG